MEVHCHHRIPHVEPDVDGTAATARERRTIDDDVETTERLGRFRDAPLVVVELRQIAHGDDTVATDLVDHPERRIGALTGDVGDGDSCALRREQDGDGLSDAEQVTVRCGSRSGDERPLAGESMSGIIAPPPGGATCWFLACAHAGSLALPIAEG